MLPTITHSEKHPPVVAVVEKKKSLIVRFFNDWKFICGIIGATIPVLVFIYSIFSWRANWDAGQTVQDNNIANVIKVDNQHWQEGEATHMQLFAIQQKTDEKLDKLQSTVDTINGKLDILTHEKPTVRSDDPHMQLTNSSSVSHNNN